MSEQSKQASIGDDAEFGRLMSEFWSSAQMTRVGVLHRVIDYIDSRPRQGDQVADWFDFNNMSLITNWLIGQGALLTPFTEEKDGDQAAAKNIIASIEALAAPRAPSDTQGAERARLDLSSLPMYHDRTFYKISDVEALAAIARQAPDTVRDVDEAPRLWITG